MAEHQDQLPDTTCPRQLFGLDLHQALTEKNRESPYLRSDGRLQ